MIWHYLDDVSLRPRLYVSAMPKSGLHMATQMVEAVIAKMPPTVYGTHHWAGTFKHNGFGGEIEDVDQLLYLLSLLRPGCFYQGHCAFVPSIQTFLRMASIPHVFVYRDLRDVAVSQAFHILDEVGDRFQHPAKRMFRAMGFDATLRAVIEGLGPYPGVMARWPMYAGWLEADMTLAVRFGDVLAEPREWAGRILNHAIQHTKPIEWITGAKIERGWFDRAVDGMMDLHARPELSPTYREGKTGSWREHFTDEHKELFKATDADGWIVRLGFEGSEDW